MRGVGKCLRTTVAAGGEMLLWLALSGAWVAPLPAQTPVEKPGRGDAGKPDRDQALLEGIGVPGTPLDGAARGLADQAPDRRGKSVPGVSDMDGSDVGRAHPLRVIGQQMRQVERWLGQRDLPAETVPSQEQIVAQLDELIAALSQSQSQQSQQMRKQEQQTRDGAPAKAAGDTAAQNADARPNPGGEGPISEIFRPGGEGVWGHLPERLRQQLRGAEAIEFLPMYRKRIENYYKRLAEDRVGPQ